MEVMIPPEAVRWLFYWRHGPGDTATNSIGFAPALGHNCSLELFLGIDWMGLVVMERG